MNPRFMSEVPFTEKQIQGEEQIGGKEVRREGDLNVLPFRVFSCLCLNFSSQDLNLFTEYGDGISGNDTVKCVSALATFFRRMAIKKK